MVFALNLIIFFVTNKRTFNITYREKSNIEYRKMDVFLIAIKINFLRKG